MPDVTFRKTCIYCGRVHIFTVDKQKFEDWQNGQHIQDVWPEKSLDEREMMISGTCPSCWEDNVPLEED